MAEKKPAKATEKKKVIRKPARRTASKISIKPVVTAPPATEEVKEVTASRKTLSDIKILFQDAWALFKSTFLPYLKIVVIGIALFITIGVIGLLLGLPLMISSGGSASDLLDGPSPLQIIGMLLVIAWVIVSVVAIIVYLFLAPVAGVFILDKKEKLSIEELFKKSKPLFFPYFLTSLMVGVLALGGWIFFVIPGLLILWIFSLVSYVVVLESIRGKAALERSYQLVKPYFWEFILRAFLIQLILYIGSTFFENIAEQMNGFYLISWTFSIVSGWFSQAYMYTLYKELRAAAPTSAPEVSLRWVWIVAGAGWLILVGLIIALSTGRLHLPELDNAIRMIDDSR